MPLKKYTKKMIDGHDNMFRKKLRTRYKPPLENGDHYELNQSTLLDDSGIHKYQFLIGSIQWELSIGRLDMTTAVMNLSEYRSVPRHGRLDCARSIVGYISEMKQAVIRVYTGLIEYSDLPCKKHD